MRIAPVLASVLSLALSVGIVSAEEAPIDVTVRGDALASRSSQEPLVASTVLRREKLGEPGTSLSDALRQVPGIQTHATGGVAELSTVSIRGATSAQTPVLLAGVVLNDDITGVADLSTIPLWMLHRAEVYRGHGPGHDDAMGIGGAIVLHPLVPRTNQLGLGTQLGSFDSRSIWLQGAAVQGPFGALVGLRWDRAANDYPFTQDHGTRFEPNDDTLERRPNADHASYDLWAIGRSQVGRLRVTSVVHGLTRDQGVSGLAAVPALASRSHMQRGLGAVSAVVPCSKDSDSCELEMVASGLLARYALRDPLRELALLTDQSYSEGEKWNYRGRVRVAVDESVDFESSLGIAWENIRHGQSGRPADHASREHLRATAGFRGQHRSVHWSAVAVAQSIASDSNDRSSDRVLPDARASVGVPVASGLELLATAGSYTRAPSLGELYGQTATVAGNPLLEPERSYGVDVGTRWDVQAPNLSTHVEAFGFARWDRSLIALERTSFRQVRPFNVGEARVLGLESSVATQYRNWIRLEGFATWMDPRDLTREEQTNNVLPHRSRLTLGANVEVFQDRLAPQIGLDYGSMGLSWFHRSSRFADRSGLVVLPLQSTLDANLATLWWKRRVGLRASVNNLLNQSLTDLVGYPLAPRSYYGSVEVWWR